jgi:hypothetical protein
MSTLMPCSEERSHARIDYMGEIHTRSIGMVNGSIQVSVGAGMPVSTENAAEAHASADHECDECAECEPVGVTVLSVETCVAEAIPGDAENDHVEDEDEKGEEGGEAGYEGHEYGAGAMVCSAAEAENDGDGGEAGDLRRIR